MSIQLLDRPFDQDRFIRLQQWAQTLIHELDAADPSKITNWEGLSRSMLRDTLVNRVRVIGEHGEHYLRVDPPNRGGVAIPWGKDMGDVKISYTLEALEDLINRTVMFLYRSRGEKL